MLLSVVVKYSKSVKYVKYSKSVKYVKYSKSVKYSTMLSNIVKNSKNSVVKCSKSVKMSDKVLCCQI